MSESTQGTEGTEETTEIDKLKAENATLQAELKKSKKHSDKDGSGKFTKKKKTAKKKDEEIEPDDPSDLEDDDPLLKEIADDYKEKLGEKYDKALDKLPLRQKISTMKFMLKMTAAKEGEGEELDKTGAVHTGTTPPAAADNRTKTIAQKNEATAYFKTMQKKGSYEGYAERWKGAQETKK